jgi:hypothetical protein
MNTAFLHDVVSVTQEPNLAGDGIKLTITYGNGTTTEMWFYGKDGKHLAIAPINTD